MEKIKALLDEYGSIAIVVWIAIFLVVLGGCFISIRWASGAESASGIGGSLGAAWLATKALQLPRIGATLALTPLIGSALKKWKTPKAG